MFVKKLKRQKLICKKNEQNGKRVEGKREKRRKREKSYAFVDSCSTIRAQNYTLLLFDRVLQQLDRTTEVPYHYVTQHSTQLSEILSILMDFCFTIV